MCLSSGGVSKNAQNIQEQSLPNSCSVPTIATLAIVRLTLPVLLPFWPPGGGAQSPAQGLLPVPGSVLEHGSYPSDARSSYDS